MLSISTSWKTLQQFLRQLFSSPHKVEDSYLLGVEINDEYIKIANISFQASQFQLNYLDIQSLPLGAIVKGVIKNPAIVLAKLLEMKKNIPSILGVSCAICIPRSIAIIKNIQLNQTLTEDEIESRVWLEANRLFPDLIKDIYLDYVMINDLEKIKENERLEAMLVACRKDQIVPIIDLLKSAEFYVKLIDVNCYALHRSLALLSIQETLPGALLNINFSNITLVIYEGKEQIFTHEMPIEGHHLVKKLQSYDKEASTSLSSLGLPLRHMLQFFYSSRPNTKLANVILTGDCVAGDHLLKQLIQAELNLPVEVAHPQKNFLVDDKVLTERLTTFLPAFMLCFGLSLSQVRS